MVATDPCRLMANRGGRDDPGPAPLSLADEFEALASKCRVLGADEDDAEMVRDETREVSVCGSQRHGGSGCLRTAATTAANPRAKLPKQAGWCFARRTVLGRWRGQKQGGVVSS